MFNRIFTVLVALSLAIGPLHASSLPPVTDVTGKKVTVNGVPTTVDAALGRVNGLAPWRSIGRRAQLGPALTPSVINPYQTSFTARMLEQVPTRGPVRALKERFCGVSAGVSPLATTTGGEPVLANSYTVKAAIEISSDPTRVSWAYNAGLASTPLPQFTFAGALSVSVAPGTCVDTDPLYVQLAAGQAYYIVSTCIVATAGQVCPATSNGSNTLFDGNNTGYGFNSVAGTGATSYTFTLAAATPIQPLSLSVLAFGQSVSIHDDGAGNILTGNGVAAGGTINYATGAITVNFSSALANGTTAAVSAFGTGGGDQTTTVPLTKFAYAGNSPNLNFGPQAILALGTGTGSTALKSIGILGGDSITEGNGNSPVDTSWIDYITRAAGIGVCKGAASGEALSIFAQPTGHLIRLRYCDGAVDRILGNEATNDITVLGKSLSAVINGFLQVQPALVAMTASQTSNDLYWTAMQPRTNTSNVAAVPGSGPYTAAGAANGSGAVVNPTPLAGGYNSGTTGNGIQTCTITGTGSVGPYTCTFSGATMVGSLYAEPNALGLTVLDTGAAGTGATTLSGAGVSTGTHTPSTGAVSLTFSNALAVGAAVKLDAYLSGPSARNAWNYWLFNYAKSRGLIKDVVDLPACDEQSAASASGAGTGLWLAPESTYTADGTHGTSSWHQTLIPGCVGPTGTSPSPVWTF